GLGYSVIRAALTGIPFAVGIGMAIGFLGQKLIPKLGRYVINLGVALMMLGYGATALVMLHYGISMSPWQLTLPILLSGLGAGFIMGPIFSVVLT
ncbi:hypothetical protein ACTGW3_12970, partial [Streptococcus suis]